MKSFRPAILVSPSFLSLSPSSLLLPLALTNTSCRRIPRIPRIPHATISEALQAARSQYELKQALRNSLFKAVKDALVQEKSKCERAFKKLQKHIRAYTGHLYKDINATLRSGVSSNKSKSNKKKVNATIEGATKALNLCRQMETCASNKVVYRGVSHLPALPQVGSIVSDAAFYSTSLEKRVACDFARGGKAPALFCIRKSQTGLFLNSKSLSTHLHEKEVLFAPNTLFRVVSVKEAEDVEEFGGNITVVTTEEVVA